MQRYAAFFYFLVAFLFSAHLEALNRDYCSDWGENEKHQGFDCDPLCLEHARVFIPEELSEEQYFLIPEIGPNECLKCKYLSCYVGYIDEDFSRYLPHLKRHLIYYSKNKNCRCFWPEYTQKAAEISNAAYLLFRELISTTALSNITETWDQPFVGCNYSVQYSNGWSKYKYPGGFYWSMNKHRLTVSFIAQQFHFSDYYHVCHDIENYAQSKYNEKEFAQIKDKLEDILEELYPKFLSLYTSCYEKHPNQDVNEEIRFMKLLVNDISGLEETMASSKSLSYLRLAQNFDYVNQQEAHIPIELECEAISFKKGRVLSNVDHKVPDYVFSPESNIFLEKGTFFNNCLLYKEAIVALTHAIQLNSSNRDAYIERALAYFETNQLQLALQDYRSAKKLTLKTPFKFVDNLAMRAGPVPLYIPENKSDFSKGLVSGTVDGAKISAEEFFPSIFSSCRGILNGLWAFVCSPIEVSGEMIDTAYAMGEFINSHNTEECFQCVVPELKELSLSWEKIDDYSRGNKIGFIIGKYGVDIFAPVGALKGISKVKALKRANTMCTLESCAASHAKQAKILEESLKRVSIRETCVLGKLKKGKICVMNSNTAYHVMQPKHAWNKIIKITGNVEEDFKTLLFLLDEQGVVSHQYSKKTFEVAGGVIRREHEKNILNQTVKIIFNEYTNTGEIFLKDAWVVTK